MTDFKTSRYWYPRDLLFALELYVLHLMFLWLASSFHTRDRLINCILTPVVYVARTLLSWSRIVSETCPAHVSDTRIMCIFKYVPRVVSISMLPCPCSIVLIKEHSTFSAEEIIFTLEIEISD